MSEAREKNTEKTPKIVKRNVKDSIFTALFGEEEYLFALYQVLHPEDKETTIDDITNVTIENVMINDLYNDLGFQVKDKLIVLVEAQTTWSMNIIPRAFMYLAKTYENYFNEEMVDLYSTSKAKLPEPELYVIYTKERIDAPKTIKLSEEFFGGKETAVEITVKMLYGEDKKDIIGQYVAFSRVVDAQIKLHGYSKEAIAETIRICKDENVLNEFLKKHEVEVMDMYNYLFNEEIIKRNHDHQLREESFSLGRNEGISIGEARGISIGRDEGRANRENEILLSMRANGLPSELIEKILKGMPS